jgi:hypothetical protein
MRHTTLSVLLLALAAVAVAQPPTPPQPLPPGPSPAPAAEAPITKYDPITVFPTPTQQAVRGVTTGANWLVRMNQAQGRFLHGYRPAVRQAMEGGDEFRQAFGALALAQAAKFTGDDRSAAVAGQSILTLLASTRPDPSRVHPPGPVRPRLPRPDAHELQPGRVRGHADARHLCPAGGRRPITLGS